MAAIWLAWLCAMGAGADGALPLGERAGALALQTLDGQPLALDNYGARTGTVVLFLSSRVRALDDITEEINRTHQRFRLREVLFVGVGASPEESGEELRIYAQRRGLVFPVYRDPSGAVARRLGATLVPEAFLFDPSGTLLYRGSVSPVEGRGGLEAAIADLVAKQPVAEPQTPAQGTPFSEIGPAREIHDPYGTVWFSAEPVFERIPGAPAHHCSTVCQAANGDLLVLWYGGSYESADDQVLFLARRADGARAWGAPEVVVRNPGQPPGNAVIFRDGLDRIWIVWGRMESVRPIRRGSGWGECRLFYRISEDNGVTWGADTEWPGTLGQLPRNVPIALRSGELLLPLSGEAGQKRGSFAMITKDNGQTWEQSAVITGGSQPTLAQRDDGSLLCLMRNRPRILQSESHDGGRTWTPAQVTPFKNPDAGIALTGLKNGHFLLVYNDTTTGRSPLSVARSVDGGKTWDKPLELESTPGEYSYPSIIQAFDGRIHVTYTFRRYTIKHAEFNEEWLVNFERPN